MCVAIAHRSCGYGAGPHCARHWQIQSKTMVSAPKSWWCKHQTRGNRWRQTQTGKHMGRARRSCKGFCVGVLMRSSLLPMSKMIQECSGLPGCGLEPKSCKPYSGGRSTPQTDCLGCQAAVPPKPRAQWAQALGCCRGNQGMTEKISVDASTESPPENVHMQL